MNVVKLAQQDHLVHLDLLAQVGLLVHVVRLVQEVNLVHQDHQDQVEIEESLDPVVLQAHRDNLDHLDQEVKLVKREGQVIMLYLLYPHYRSTFVETQLVLETYILKQHKYFDLHF